jgi:DASS family divalent anion:Na+ symporter
MTAASDGRRAALARTATLALVLGLWFFPVPEGLTAPAWRLFALFISAIFSVIVGAFPILTASVLAVAAAVLSGTLTPAKAYAGFANPTIVLIVVAFLVARAVVKCGLGQRLGHLLVGLFGRSTLGLSYSIFLLDGVIAPAFPSNTARAGVLYPLVVSLAETGGADPAGERGRRRLGSFLMFAGMASLSLSSALWFTAMAGNPLGAEVARTFGLEIGF